MAAIYNLFSMGAGWASKLAPITNFLAETASSMF